MTEHNLYDERERGATPRPGRYRPWFLGVLIAWWIAGCVVFARGGVLAGVLALEAECALLLALDHANVLTLHGLLPRRLRRGWGRVVAVFCAFVLAPVVLALYLGLAARHIWLGTERAEVAVPFAPGPPIAGRTPQPDPEIDTAPSIPMPAAVGATRAKEATPTRHRTAFLVGSGMLAILLLCACAFVVAQAQSGPLATLLGAGASSGTSRTTSGQHHTASAGQRAPGPGATSTATTISPTATATTAPTAPTTGTQPAAPTAPDNGGDTGQGASSTAGAQSPGLPIIPAILTTPPPTTPPSGTARATTSGGSITAAQLAAAERALPTVYVPSLQMTFSCAGSDASKAFCVRARPETRVTITLYAECAGTGGQGVTLTRERTVSESGVLRWSWRPEQPCARGLALAIITTLDGQQHLVLAVTRDPPVS